MPQRLEFRVTYPISGVGSGCRIVSIPHPQPGETNPLLSRLLDALRVSMDREPDANAVHEVVSFSHVPREFFHPFIGVVDGRYRLRDLDTGASEDCEVTCSGRVLQLGGDNVRYLLDVPNSLFLERIPVG